MPNRTDAREVGYLAAVADAASRVRLVHVVEIGALNGLGRAVAVAGHHRTQRSPVAHVPIPRNLTWVLSVGRWHIRDGVAVLRAVDAGGLRGYDLAPSAVRWW